MNENHRRCGSEEWRDIVRSAILPWALEDVSLGDEVLEVGPGYGATTDVLSESVANLTAVEIDQELAEMLEERYAGRSSVHIVHGDATALEFADSQFSGAACFTMLHHVPSRALQDQVFSQVARVLRPGAVFVLGDSLASPELEAHHEGDTYNPLAPEDLPGRLGGAGFTDIVVKTNEFGWVARAHKA